ncbi:MAG: hypothetical protein M1830_007486 [Pleopsidium flavum]|nr:MAG: hypothetical protein M1830_007486 [Pleopsidium flavum]
MQPSKGRTMLESESDDDDVSVTSTVMSEVREEYPLEKILAERTTENGLEWLVKWEGYPDERSTWETKTSFTSEEPLFDWQAQKMRIARGYEKPYNVAALEARVGAMEDAQAFRKARRRAKRVRLGMTVSQQESEPESSEEAEESVDEIPLERSPRSRRGSRRDLPRNGYPSLDGFVVEEEENVRTGTGLKNLRDNKGAKKRTSDYETDDQASDDSLVEDLKVMEFNKTHKRLKRKSKPHVEDVPIRNPERPPRQIPQVRSDRRQSIPTLPTPQYSGTMYQAKSRLKGAAGTGPKRFVKKQPQSLGKPKVQGAAILGNWTASLKPRKRTTVAPGAAPSLDPKTFNKLSVKRRYEKAGRNEPAPNPENLVLINLKKGNVIKPSAAPLHRSNVLTKKPWEIIQERLNEEAKERRQVQQLSVADLGLNADFLMDIDTSESPLPLNELNQTPTQATEPIQPIQTSGQPLQASPPPAPTTETIPRSLAESTDQAPCKPSLLFRSDAPDGPSVPNSRGNDESLVSSTSGLNGASLGAPDSAYGQPFAPESLATHVLATIRVGPKGQEMGDVRIKGLDKPSKSRLLRTKAEGRMEVCFKVSCTADDYRRFFCGQDSRTFATGYIEPFWNTASAINAVAETLKTHVSGGLCFQDEFVMLAYPAGMPDWDFIDAGMPPPPKVSLQFLMRSPLSPPIHDWSQLPLEDTKVLISSDEPRIITVFRHLFNIEYKKLVSQNSKKNQDPNIFLMFPPSCNDEHDLVVNFLEANGAVIYSSRTKGSWDYFTSCVDAGVVLIHPTFYAYHTIPSLPTVLKKNINVFSLGTSLEPSFDPSSSPPYKTIYTPTFACERLFPHGGAILLTESLFLEDPKAAKVIVKWFKEYSDKKSAGTWKLVCRPNICEWLADLSEERHEEGGIYYEIYSTLTPLLNNNITSNHSDSDSSPPLISPTFLPTPQNRSPTYLIEWFAGWASCHVNSFRRFHVVHPVVVEAWMERWKTLEVMTPEEFVGVYKIGNGNGEGRRKSVGS